MSIFIYSKGNRALNIVFVFLVLSLFKPIYKNKISLTLLPLVILAEIAYICLAQTFSLFELHKYLSKVLELPIRYFVLIVISPVFSYITEVVWLDIFKNSINENLQKFANKHHSNKAAIICIVIIGMLCSLPKYS